MTTDNDNLHVAPVKTVAVRWYTCDCDWITKHCDEHHTARATVPEAVLQMYKVP